MQGCLIVVVIIKSEVLLFVREVGVVCPLSVKYMPCTQF
jgi:hypothetical protein